MGNAAKINLSEQELQLVNNREWILTKHKIINIVFQMFGDLSEEMKSVTANQKQLFPLPENGFTPKIYKGENYLQLPYVLLDYPRCFNREDIFAVRTMFWWGNFFSITLHLAGRYKKDFEENILRNLSQSGAEYFICIHETQWHHYFEPDNYIATAKKSHEELAAIIRTNNFTKIALRSPLGKWNEMPRILISGFENLVALLKP
jgi:hypothetical protein